MTKKQAMRIARLYRAALVFQDEAWGLHDVLTDEDSTKVREACFALCQQDWKQEGPMFLNYEPIVAEVMGLKYIEIAAGRAALREVGEGEKNDGG